MSTPKKDLLFDLMASLTKAEKRNFRMYAKKIQQSEEVLFLQLFDYLEKQVSYDVNVLLNDLKNIKKKQIPNLKRNLYHHILSSLRMLYSQKQITLQIREYLDYAEILYNKGLYFQAIKVLGRAKKIATKSNQHLLQLEINVFESKIQSRHITRSSTEGMTLLMQEAIASSSIIYKETKLANLKLYLQRVFINRGHLKTLSEQEKISAYFFAQIQHTESSSFTFFEKVYLYQSYYWYYFLLQNFEKCHQYTQWWVQLYNAEKDMIDRDMDMYLRAVHHRLNTSFFIRNTAHLDSQLRAFEKFLQKHKKDFTRIAYIQAHLFYYQAAFNNFFLQEKYQEGQKIIPNVQEFIDTYHHQLDDYKIMILYYKMAACCLGVHQPAAAINYINQILNESRSTLREDILIYARILGIWAHYQMENLPSFDYLLNAANRQIAQQANPDQLSRLVLSFFHQLNKTVAKDQSNLFEKIHWQLKQLRKDPTENRAFIFLDAERLLEKT